MRRSNLMNRIGDLSGLSGRSLASAAARGALLSLPVALLFLLSLTTTVRGQRRYTVTKPKERSGSETVKVRTSSRQSASRGVLVVLVEPVLPGEIRVSTPDGRDLGRATADLLNGQAEFTLPRDKAYLIEVSHPGYASTTVRSRPLGQQAVVRVRLNARSASLRLRDLPVGAKILIDDQARATVTGSDDVTITEIQPGDHRLRIVHPEYNDFEDTFEVIEAGEEVSFGRIPLTRVARLEVEGPAGAAILIDGAMQGRITESGRLLILYELDRSAERTIAAELTGFQPWRLVTALGPGPRTIRVQLTPVETSAGVSDFFDSLSQWSPPATWSVSGDNRNKKLEVRGPEPGQRLRAAAGRPRADRAGAPPPGPAGAVAGRALPAGDPARRRAGPHRPRPLLRAARRSRGREPRACLRREGQAPGPRLGAGGLQLRQRPLPPRPPHPRHPAAPWR
ncbi:MAG: PEGA domain-containing protein [Acidobacteria bacterium]|nr:PEGA domain-containing protein [Acidobacteriota bacterium]